MRVSPSYIRSQGYNLQKYAADRDGQTSPPYEETTSILAWFAIHPRTEDQRKLTARWREGDITFDVTARLGPNGGLSSPEEGQGLQYRRYDVASDEVQTGEIRADGMVHATILPDREPLTVHGTEAAERIYRNLGSAAVALTVPRSSDGTD